ncbi:hypothetical protein GCM10010121_071890 [Streptomyces brasiliensis]|uniref:Uncharacterized protein n=1 Tax=Streptomyces brasiliensis TaxID=1954 RepID=A0A917LAI0_9ACTN|nr:hypothetical protein GCM10010121_071890 [Streptomyces brasiliensis]
MTERMNYSAVASDATPVSRNGVPIETWDLARKHFDEQQIADSRRSIRVLSRSKPPDHRGQLLLWPGGFAGAGQAELRADETAGG